MEARRWIEKLACTLFVAVGLATGALIPCLAQDQPEPRPYEVNCSRPHDHEAADLCEQRRMAKAAEDAVWWARFQTILGTFGFVAVLVSLFFTGWAAIAASRAARSARDAVHTATTTAERELRAYV